MEPTFCWFRATKSPWTQKVLLMATRNPARKPPGMYKTLVNNGMNYQPQLVNAGFLNHQSYDHPNQTFQSNQFHGAAFVTSPTRFFLGIIFSPSFYLPFFSQGFSQVFYFNPSKTVIFSIAFPISKSSGSH